MFHVNALIPFLHISKKFNLPSEISHYIYYVLINDSAQIIMHSWWSHIKIHNTNLCYIVNKLSPRLDYDMFGHPFFWYDNTDIKVLYTFNICLKYIKPAISDYDYWLDQIKRLINGRSMLNNTNFPNQNSNNISDKLFIVYSNLYKLFH